MKIVFSRHIVEKYSSIKFHGNPSCESRVVPCGRTDGGGGQTWYKFKFTLEQTTKTQRGNIYSSTLSLTSALEGVGGQRHVPAALLPGNARYPLYRRLSGPQGRSGRVRKISPPHGDSIPGPSSPLQFAIPTELSRPTRQTRRGFIFAFRNFSNAPKMDAQNRN